ncbi:MAG: hypothetical protein EOM37_08450 [Proteobacteria bacterium]|nr:hypothetical protein [Alphaproteobacteria bacterium]NCC04058.1 hypothetical protein [Pseudomonadota bacterium]
MATPVSKWLDNMRTFWIEKQPDRIAEILAPSLEYYEDPFKPPLTTVGAVVSAWQEIKGQEIEFVEIELLHESAEGIGTAIWRFKTKDSPEHIGCYFIKIDKKGKCVYFRQFWNSKRLSPNVN